MAYANPAAGTRRSNYPAADAIANVSAPNATDLESAQALANELKTKLNAALAALRAAGLIES